MYIQIDGTNTLNRGAELMLTAVLEQLEEHEAQAKVLYNPNAFAYPFLYQGNLKFKERSILKYSRYPDAILRRLHLPRSFFTAKYASRKVDVILDAGGFQFSDQWGYPQNYVDLLENYYSRVYKHGTKLIFLPQAFGPFKTSSAQQSLEIINRYANLIIAREQISYDYLIKGGADPEKVKIYPDFTLKVAGSLPDHFKHLQHQVCLIPNYKMISHTSGTAQNYLDFMISLIRKIKEKDHQVYLLNHEGAGDLKLCEQINQVFNNKLEIISDLNAKEIKGVIGSAYLVISSRFHGVASALSQAVPCLSTSWNHKYEMLYKDYELEDMVLNLDQDFEAISAKVSTLLEEQDNKAIRSHIRERKLKLHQQTDKMWGEVFDLRHLLFYFYRSLRFSKAILDLVRPQ